MKKALIALVVGLFALAGTVEIQAQASRWVRLSEVSGSDYSSRLAAALRMAASGSRQLLIDESGTLKTPLPALTSPAHDDLRIASQGATVRAGIKMTRVFFIRTAQNVSIEGLRVDLGGQAVYGIDAHGDGFRARGVEIFGGRPGKVDYGINLQGSSATISDFVVRGLQNSVRVHAPPSKSELSDIRIAGGHLSGCAGRGISAIGQGSLSRLWLENNVFERLDVGCQPIRVDGLSARSPFKAVHITGNSIIDPGAEHGADDTISVHGVRGFLVMGNVVERTSDVGVNVSGSGSDGVIAANRVSNAEYCVNIGSGDPDGRGPRLGDRATSGVTGTLDILAAGNQCSNWKHAMLRAAEADRIAFIANAGQIGPGTPYRPAPNAFQSLDAQSIIYDQNDASGFIAERLRETVRSKPSSYFPLAGPVRIAMVDPAGKVVSAATRGIRDIRRLAPGEYLLSLNTPISNPNTQVKVFPDGIYSNRASHHISDPNTVRVRLTGQNGDLVDGGFAVLITSSGR